MTDTDNTRRHLSIQTVQTARDILSIFFLKKHTFQLTFIAVIVGALLLSFLTPSIYQTSALLLIKPQYSKPLVFDQDTTRVSEINKVDENTLNTIILLLNSPEVLREVVLKHRLAKSADERDILKAVDDLRGSVKAEPQSLSSIIQVTQRGRSAQEVTDQLNTLLDSYIRHHIQTYQSTKGRLAFFDDQTQQFRNRYLQVTNELVAASKELNVIKPDLQKEKSLLLVKDMEFAKLQLYEKIQMLRARNATFGSLLSRLKQDGPEAILPSIPRDAIFNYPALVEMEKSLAQLLINRQRAHSDFQENSKPVRDADTQYFNMKMQIRRQMEQITTDIGVEIASALRAINEMDAQIQEITQKNVKLAGDTLEYERLELDQRMNKDNYIMYNAKKEEARINDEKDLAMFANVAIVSRPLVPTSPWFPQPGKIMLLSLPVALILAMALSAGSYAWEKRVWTPTDLGMYTQVHYLGSLDAVGSARAQPAARRPYRPLVPARRDA